MPEDLLNKLLLNTGNLLTALAALGTAAYGLVDTSKAFWGGASNAGFGFVRKAIEPFIKGVSETTDQTTIGPAQILITLRANWLNGVAKADQKAAAKSLIRLCITPKNAPHLAAAAGVDATELTKVAKSISDGTSLSPQDINVLGRFDAIVSAVLDAGYERADQKYRNMAKLLAGLVSIVIAAIGGGILFYANSSPHASASYLGSSDFLLSILVGAMATPLAPIAKDISSALVGAVNALRATRR
jgi:hypothetical protein